MKKSEWNDNQVEELLKYMPTIKDHRSAQEIYTNVSIKTIKRPRQRWIIPSLAAVAAAVLIVILAPSYLQDSHFSTSDKMDSEKSAISMKTTDKKAESKENNSYLEDHKNEQLSMLGVDALPETYVVSHDDIDHSKSLLTYGVNFDAQIFTYVSIIDENTNEDTITELNQAIPNLNNTLSSENWGLNPYPVEYFTLSEMMDKNGEKGVRAVISSEISTESLASTEVGTITHALTSVFLLPDNYSRVDLYQNEKHGVILGQSGTVTESIPKVDKKIYYYYSSNDTSRKFLVSIASDKINKIEHAFTLMQKDQEIGIGSDYKLSPTILENIQYTLEEDGSHLTIRFLDTTHLENSDPYILMVEAMMLTAKEFGFGTVTFKGSIDQIGEVIFEKSIPVPLAPNPITLLE